MFQESLTAFLGLNQEVEQNGAHTLALMTGADAMEILKMELAILISKRCRNI